MKKAIDSKGNLIGSFDGNTINDSNGKVIYRISDGEVFAQLKYCEDHLQAFNKGYLPLLVSTLKVNVWRAMKLFLKLSNDLHSKKILPLYVQPTKRNNDENLV